MDRREWEKFEKYNLKIWQLASRFDEKGEDKGECALPIKLKETLSAFSDIALAANTTKNKIIKKVSNISDISTTSTNHSNKKRSFLETWLPTLKEKNETIDEKDDENRRRRWIGASKFKK